MPSAIQATLGSNFDRLAESFSPKLTGGILNHVFEPIASDLTGEVVLKRRDFTTDYLIKTVKYTILHSIQSTDVLDILPLAEKQKQYGGNHYLFGIIVAVLAILFSLGIWITLIVFPLCARKKQKDRGATNGTGYRVFAVICVLFTVAGILLAIFGFIATGALVTSLNPNVRDTPNADGRVSEAIASLVKQLPSLFHESIDSGINQSHSALRHVRKTFEEILKNTISGIIADFVEAYRAKGVIDHAKHLSSDLYSLIKKITSVYKLHVETVIHVSEFLRKARQQRASLADDLEQLCPSMMGEPRKRCNDQLANIQAINLFFDSSQIDTDSLRIVASINEFLNQHLSDLTNDTNAVDHIFDRLSEEIFIRITRVVDVEHVHTILDSFLNTFRESASSELKFQLRQLQPQVKKYNKQAYIAVSVVGFTVLALCLSLLLIGLVYIILYILKSSDCQTCVPPPFILTIVYAILGFLLLLGSVFTILVPVISWAHNDVCRYAIQPDGMVITDTALNLWLEYQWPRLLRSLAEDKAYLIQSTPPQNVLRAVTSSCRTSGRNGRKRGLLSLVGLNNAVNTTAIFKLPVIRKAIQDTEQTIVRFVINLNISSMIPDDLENLIETIRNLVNTFGDTNYTDSIGQAKTIVNARELDRTLQQLSQFLDGVRPGTNHRRMQQTITSIRNLLADDYQKLTAQVDKLIAEIQTIESVDPLRPRFNSLVQELLEVVAIARDPARVIQPIVPIYRKWTSSIINTITLRSKSILSNFVSGLFPCSRLYTMTTTVLNVTCSSSGEISLLGSFSTLAAANIVMVLTTMLITQIFIYMMPQTVV